MIQNNELRLGNLLQTKYGVKCVTFIASERPYRETTFQCEGGYIESECNPIPLTKDILENKFNLKKDKQNYDRYILNERTSVVWDGVDAVWFVDDTQIQTTEYVHLFQNLYFFLIGKELVHNGFSKK